MSIYRKWIDSLCALHRPEVPMSAEYTLPPDLRDTLGEEAGEWVEDLVANGYTESAALDLVLDVFDLLTPLEVLVPGPIGVALDEALDTATEKGLQVAAEALRRDPAKMRRRAMDLAELSDDLREAGKTKRAERKAKRSARLMRRADELEHMN